MARLEINLAQERKTTEVPARKLVEKVLRETEALARIRIPKKTGATSRRFVKSTVVLSGVVRGVLANTSEVGWWLHEGTPPHREPIYKPGPMHFYWEKRGKWVTLAKVHHPGIKPVRYLTDPLKLIGKENGFKVETHLIGPSG